MPSTSFHVKFQIELQMKLDHKSELFQNLNGATGMHEHK